MPTSTAITNESEYTSCPQHCLVRLFKLDCHEILVPRMFGQLELLFQQPRVQKLVNEAALFGVHSIPCILEWKRWIMMDFRQIDYRFSDYEVFPLGDRSGHST